MFGFQIPEDLGLEVAGKHSSSSEHISWDAIRIWLRIHFSWQILMHQLQSTIIFPTLRLKCQFKNLPEMYIILHFTQLYQLLNKKKHQ